MVDSLGAEAESFTHQKNSLHLDLKCRCTNKPENKQQQLQTHFESFMHSPGTFLELYIELKMAIILPTGQWYAPSAVINDAWYCMVLHCIAWYCMVLHGIAWY